MGNINTKIGDAAAIHGDINISERNIVHEHSKTAADIARDKNTLFVNACKRAYSDAILTKAEEAELELYREELGLDTKTANDIKESVKQMAKNTRFKTPLNPTARIICKQFRDAIKSNNISKLQDMLDSMQSLAENNANEELHYMFYLVAAALDPQRCVKLYDERNSDENYWQTYWSYLALINLGRKDDAEELLMGIPNIYADYPEDNATVLAAVGIMMEEGKESIQMYVNEIQGEYSPLLQNFVDSLYQMASPDYASESGIEASECDFYLQRVLFIKGVSSGNKEVDAQREYNRIVEDARKDSRIEYNEDCTILIECTDEDIEEFDVPSCVKHISENAFGYCPNLKRVTLPEGLLSIDKFAFMETAIEEIVIPDSVNQIGDSAFMDCSSLKRVKLPKDLSTISESTFFGTNIEEVCLPKSVKSIEKAAFADCQSLKKVVFNEGLQSIEELAFNGSTIQSIDLPSSLKTIGEKAFAGSDLESVVIPSGVTTIDDGAFAYCENLTKADIPGGVSYLGEDLFAESGLVEVTLYPGIKRIPAGMFRESCIENIAIPDSVEEIGANAFSKCKQLTHVNLPDSVHTIEACAFKGVNDECSVHLSNTRNISDLNLEGLDFIGKVYVPKGYGAQYLELPIFKESACFLYEEGCDVIVDAMLRNQESKVESQPTLNIEFSEDMKEIVLFSEMDMEAYSIPEGVTSIYPGAFCGCEKLKKLILPSTLERIGSAAFEDLGIESLIIPSRVTIIAKNAFKSCDHLSSLEFKAAKLDNVQFEGLPDNPNVKIIVPKGALGIYKSNASFAKYTNIVELGGTNEGMIQLKDSFSVKKGIVDPDEQKREEEAKRIKEEESQAESQQSTLNIEFSEDMKEIVLFSEMDMEAYSIPEGVTSIYPGAFCGCEKLKKLILPSTLERIGSTAFEDLGIESLIIPSGVTIIAKNAFKSCDHLSSLEFKAAKLDNVQFEGLPDNPNVKIIVPKGALGIYKSNASFAKYTNIVELGGTTVVKNPGKDSNPTKKVNKTNAERAQAEAARELENHTNADPHMSSVQLLWDKIAKIHSHALKGKPDSSVLNEKKQLNQEIIDAITMFPVPNTKEDILEFLALAAPLTKTKGGLWGTIHGRIILLAIAVVVVFVLCIILGGTNFFENRNDPGGAGWGAMFAFLIIIWGGLACDVVNQDIILENKKAVAWRTKFEQVLLKGRSLRGDADFSQMLDYFEKQLKK